MVAILLWKVLLIFLFPLIGIAAGILFLFAKIVFVGVLLCIAIWVFRRLARREEKLA